MESTLLTCQRSLLTWLFGCCATLLPMAAFAGSVRLNLSVTGRIFAVEPSCKSNVEDSASSSDQEKENTEPTAMCVFLTNPFALPTIDIESPSGCSKSGESLGRGGFTLFLNDQPYDPSTSNVVSQLQLFQLRYGLDLGAIDESLVCERSGILRIRY